MSANITDLRGLAREPKPATLNPTITAESLVRYIGGVTTTLGYVTSGSPSLTFGDQFCSIAAEGLEDLVHLAIEEQLYSRLEQQQSWQDEDEESGLMEEYARRACFLRVFDWCASQKPNFADYMGRIEALAARYEAEKTVVSREELEAIYDDAFFEAERHQKDLL